MKVDLINDVTMTPDKSTRPGGLPLNDVLLRLGCDQYSDEYRGFFSPISVWMPRRSSSSKEG